MTYHNWKPLDSEFLLKSYKRLRETTHFSCEEESSLCFVRFVRSLFFFSLFLAEKRHQYGAEMSFLNAR